MKLASKRGCIVFDETDGRILSLKQFGREFIRPTMRPLITIFLLDEKGHYTEAVSGGNMQVMETEDKLVMRFTAMSGLPVNATATVEVDGDGYFCFGLTVENETGLLLESYDYPCVCVPNELKGNGGDGYLFWPAVEGVVIDDLSIKQSCGMLYRKDPFPSYGWGGHYPGSCQMQFSAYFNDDGCLYFAAHDKDCNPKVIELEPVDGAVRFQYRTFPGKPYAKKQTMSYPMVIGVMKGDWYDAAEKYRTWMNTTDIVRLPKWKNNRDIPDWIFESPVVIMYAVMGEDSAARIRDEVYYPYTVGVPYLDNLGKKFDSKVLALIAHWEGTAPWAPPYMWPPYGDLENFKLMIAQMHEKGHRIGLYCSGTAWSQQSGLREEYICEEQFEQERLAKVMQVGPTRELTYSYICAWPFRRGYDMCPATEFTKEVSVSEACKIVSNLDIDYLQFFDQNIGGNSYPCYADNHGHVPVPGKWLNESMLDLIHRLKEKTVLASGKNVVIGCEANAAEPFVNDLIFNDSRHNIGYFVGTPVSAYNYMFHEYFNNFMGNQNTSHTVIDCAKYLNNIFYRTAHAFAQGDFLTVVMKGGGLIGRDCCTPWDIKPDIDQEGYAEFVRLLNAWRKGCVREALFFGRLVKPAHVECDRYYEDIKYGGKHNFPAVVTEKYETDDGTKIQLLVNYMPYEQTVTVDHEDASAEIVADEKGNFYSLEADDGKLTVTLPARSVRAIRS